MPTHSQKIIKTRLARSANIAYVDCCRVIYYYPKSVTAHISIDICVKYVFPFGE